MKAAEECKEAVLWVLQETDTEIVRRTKGLLRVTHGKERGRIGKGSG